MLPLEEPGSTGCGWEDFVWKSCSLGLLQMSDWSTQLVCLMTLQLVPVHPGLSSYWRYPHHLHQQLISFVSQQDGGVISIHDWEAPMLNNEAKLKTCSERQFCQSSWLTCAQLSAPWIISGELDIIQCDIELLADWIFHRDFIIQVGCFLVPLLIVWKY